MTNWFFLTVLCYMERKKNTSGYSSVWSSGGQMNVQTLLRERNTVQLWRQSPVSQSKTLKLSTKRTIFPTDPPLDLFTSHLQTVRLGLYLALTLALSTGAPQGCVLDPFASALYTYDGVPIHLTVVQLADDMIAVKCMSGQDEMVYTTSLKFLHTPRFSAFTILLDFYQHSSRHLVFFAKITYLPCTSCRSAFTSKKLVIYLIHQS